jgi:hypothetical protein
MIHGMSSNESPAPAALISTTRRTPWTLAAASTLRITPVMKPAGLTGLAQGASELRLLLSALITASLPAIARSTSAADEGELATTLRRWSLRVSASGRRTSATVDARRKLTRKTG